MIKIQEITLSSLFLPLTRNRQDIAVNRLASRWYQLIAQVAPVITLNAFSMEISNSGATVWRNETGQLVLGESGRHLAVPLLEVSFFPRQTKCSFLFFVNVSR